MAYNKKDLINHVVLETRCSKEQTQEIIEAVFSGLIHLLKQSEHVRIKGFGAFIVQQVSQRQGRNPRTGEQIQVAARKRITFKSGIDLKSAFNTKDIFKTKEKGHQQKKPQQLIPKKR